MRTGRPYPSDRRIRENLEARLLVNRRCRCLGRRVWPIRGRLQSVQLRGQRNGLGVHLCGCFLEVVGACESSPNREVEQTSTVAGLPASRQAPKYRNPPASPLGLSAQKPASTIRIEVPLRFVPFKDSGVRADHPIMETATTLKEATALEETTSPQRRWSTTRVLLLLLVVAVLVLAVLVITADPLPPDCFTNLAGIIDPETGQIVPEERC